MNRLAQIEEQLAALDKEEKDLKELQRASTATLRKEAKEKLRQLVREQVGGELTQDDIDARSACMDVSTPEFEQLTAKRTAVRARMEDLEKERQAIAALAAPERSLEEIDEEMALEREGQAEHTRKLKELQAERDRATTAAELAELPPAKRAAIAAQIIKAQGIPSAFKAGTGTGSK